MKIADRKHLELERELITDHLHGLDKAQRKNERNRTRLAVQIENAVARLSEIDNELNALN